MSRRFGKANENEISRVRTELTAAGVEFTDLTDSNPTRHGLTDSRVLAAVSRSANRAGVYDPHPRGPLAARESLAARFGGTPGDYWLTASTSEAYSWLFALLTNPGDSIAVPAPGYPLIEPLAQLSELNTLSYPLHYVHPEWIYDLEAFRVLVEPSKPGALSRQAPKAAIIVNPGNPTGAYTPQSVTDEIAEICASSSIALIADEVFGPFTFKPDTHTTFSGEERALTFTLDGLSKLLCAPGLKLSWIRVSGPPGDVASAAEILDQIADSFLSVNSAVAGALPELLEIANSVVDHTCQRLSTNITTVNEIFGVQPYRVRTYEGGWTVLVDTPALIDDTELVVRLMREAQLYVHPGWFYDLVCKGTLALSLLPEPKIFVHNCQSLRNAISNLY